jgi:beta-xylosidase
MKFNYIAIISILFILACGLGPQTPSATEPAALPPTQTPLSSPTPTIPTQTIPAEPSPDPIYFRDDFDTTLDAGWVWINEDSSNWSLTAVPGMLQINAGSGSVYDDTITNLLLRPAPTGDFQFETKVTFQPNADFQFAGLIAYESPLNFIQAGRAFCGSLPTCAGDGLYIDYYQNGEFILPNFAVPYTETDEIYLRLVRESGTYVFHTSQDGSEWILRGGQASAGQPTQIGVAAGQNSADIIPALFDYFEVSSLE